MSSSNRCRSSSHSSCLTANNRALRLPMHYSHRGADGVRCNRAPDVGMLEGACFPKLACHLLQLLSHEASHFLFLNALSQLPSQAP